MLIILAQSYLKTPKTCHVGLMAKSATNELSSLMGSTIKTKWL